MVDPKKNTRLVLMLVGAFVFMGAAAFAAVPLYRLFCPLSVQTGAQSRVNSAPKTASNQLIRVHFDANVSAIPWTFKPDQPYQDVRIGKTAMAYFTVTNNAKTAITGRATYNIQPDILHDYFLKLQCFCFTDETLQAGETKRFPVVYFLDPKMLKDPDAKNVPDVTLSYTYFKVKPGQ
ncbi:cytochrome c oxidase assembly protein [Asticcacaulis sp. EMRT-3]|uniref:cytochrome c oxidase assembly protein n=1 Tax=Asticcacaulis sp. EMRT-3 TaxID=3040349 RepID=UPI0024AEAAEC|nr:cytochrome c oxidase assembly protein [Asticcacaulis sp. EMRT-3]MDI7774714.1 cytochrome c oxidase assembly protein [Asticcacaulis sp. EMRT-3]